VVAWLWRGLNELDERVGQRVSINVVGEMASSTRQARRLRVAGLQELGFPEEILFTYDKTLSPAS
jgi:hypothetical protein